MVNQDKKQRIAGIIKHLVREEFRFHTELFGVGRFIGFPIFIMVLVSVGLLGVTELRLGSVQDVLLTVHGLFFLFALQIGSVAFMADEAADDLLGGRSTTLYSHTYLPITQEFLIILFVLKDIAFYTMLFVFPATIGVFLTLPISLLSSGLLLLSLSLVFTIGISLSLFIASLGLQSRSQSITIAILFLTIITILFTQTPLTITSVLVYSAPTVLSKLLVLVGSIVLAIAFGVFSIQSLELSNETEQATTYTNIISRLLNTDSTEQKATALHAILTRTTSDVLRSGGGLFKLFFTISILVGITAYLLTALSQTTAITPNYTITTTLVLALASYANYVWIFQNDSLEEYQYLPISEPMVFDAKRRAFHYFNTTLLVGTVLITGVVFTSSIESIIGMLVLSVAISDFYFIFTFLLANYAPMDFLFDTARFSFFSTTLMLLFIPVLIIGLFGTLFMTPVQILVFLLACTVIFTILGQSLKLYLTL